MPAGSKPPPGALTQEIAATLRALIARRGLKHGDVARAAVLKPQTFSAIINARKQVDLEQLDRICWALGLDVADVIKKAEKATNHRQASKGWEATRISPTLQTAATK